MKESQRYLPLLISDDGNKGNDGSVELKYLSDCFFEFSDLEIRGKIQNKIVALFPDKKINIVSA